MRAIWMAGAALALLAGCAENTGWNPNYRYPASPYGQYLQDREAALTGQRAEPPRVVPVTLPQRAPTPEEIAGQPLVVTRPAPVAAQPAPAAAPAQTVRARPARVTGAYGAAAPILTRYAQAVQHDPGTQLWQRPGGSANAAARACRGYQTPEAAQIAFIAQGGPQLDPLGLDPDGDGFVCGWDPRPLRAAGL